MTKGIWHKTYSKEYNNLYDYMYTKYNDDNIIERIRLTKQNSYIKNECKVSYIKIKKINDVNQPLNYKLIYSNTALYDYDYVVKKFDLNNLNANFIIKNINDLY
jgi:hypothetical protein